MKVASACPGLLLGLLLGLFVSGWVQAASPIGDAVAPIGDAVTPDGGAVTPDDSAVAPDDSAVVPDDSAVVPAAAPSKISGNLPRGVIKLDETVISGNQELPKVLYILPWREPGGLPDIELQTEFAEKDVFRRLYPPAYRRELSYFKTLDETE